MYFQQIYRFEVYLLKKFAMSFSLEQSRPREILAGRYELRWGSGLQHTCLDLEAKCFNEYADSLNSRSIIMEVGVDETIAGAWIN